MHVISRRWRLVVVSMNSIWNGQRYKYLDVAFYCLPVNPGGIEACRGRVQILAPQVVIFRRVPFLRPRRRGD